MFSALKGLLSGSNSSNSSIPVTSGPGLCVNCKFRQQARNPTTGQYYLFCSNACAAPRTLPGLPTGSNVGGGQSTSMGVNSNTITRPSPSPSLCNHCKKKPRYNDGVTVQPYCGRTCANLATGKGAANMNVSVSTNPAKTTNPFIATSPSNITAPRNTASPLNTATSTNNTNRSVSTKNNVLVPVNPRNSTISTISTNAQNSRLPVHQTTSSGPTCQIPGCSSPAYVDPNGVAGNYCTKTHRQWGQRGCISCRKAPTNGVAFFCQVCHDKFLRMAPMIVQVPVDHERYKSVASQFQQKWKRNARCPKIQAIYKIVSTTANLEKYKQYLDRVESKGNFASQNKPRGNESRRWHGTTRKCRIGDTGVTNFCSDQSCSLCCIMKSSFDLSLFAKKTNCGMFGAGIYTSATSSKSDRYSHNDFTSDCKAMLLNKVVVGRGYKMVVYNATLTEPPAGYDSVLGEAGTHLNYDELVVYNNDAIRPSYLVMYDTP